MTRRIHVGVDATTWWNDRGFGRFTRELMTALLARPNSEFRYTFVVDREPNGELPSGVDVLSAAGAKNLDESAVGSTSRSPAYLIRLAAALWRAKFDVFFFPAVYSYFPLPLRRPAIAGPPEFLTQPGCRRRKISAIIQHGLACNNET